MATKAHEIPNHNNAQAILSLVPMLNLREAKNWSIIGLKSLAKIKCAIFIELYGKKTLESKDCLNEFYADAISMRDEGVSTAVNMVE